MFRNAGIKVSDQEFKEIMYMTTDDIRENRIKFGKKTNLQQMFTIALRSLKVLRQCDMAVNFYFDGYTAHEAVRKAKYDLDDDEIYDMETGQTIGEIELATDEQIRILLQTEKDPLQRVQK
jgi:hypothetical protein